VPLLTVFYHYTNRHTWKQLAKTKTDTFSECHVLYIWSHQVSEADWLKACDSRHTGSVQNSSSAVCVSRFSKRQFVCFHLFN
jgi:hypothetical protein